MSKDTALTASHFSYVLRNTGEIRTGRSACLTDPTAQKPDIFTQTQGHLLVPGHHSKKKKIINNLQSFALLLQIGPLCKIQIIFAKHNKTSQF